MPIELVGPVRYSLSFDSTNFTVCCPRGTSTFSGLATSDLPKLYIVSVEERPIYVGITTQTMRKRLRLGWNAKGESGYYGYKWRHNHKEAKLDIWNLKNPDQQEPHALETIEAEVVFQIRSAGQWPLFQNEIHFHPSDTIHRDLAHKIVSRYNLEPLRPIQP